MDIGSELTEEVGEDRFRVLEVGEGDGTEVRELGWDEVHEGDPRGEDVRALDDERREAQGV